jgi:hypothetical protein
MKVRTTDTARFEIFRVQTHFAVERLIEEATKNGFSADDAIDVLEQALDVIRTCHSTSAIRPKTLRLF